LYQTVRNIEQEVATLEQLPQFVNVARLKRDPIVTVDIGARGGLPDYLLRHSAITRPVLFEADQIEAERLRARFPEARVYSVALSNEEKQANLYLTKNPGNSSLLPPEGSMLGLMEGHGSLERYEVVESVAISTKSLHSVMASEFSSIDLMKIDVQGAESEIVDGMGSYRPFAMVIESSTTEIYRSQLTIFELGARLRGMGYFPIRLMEYRNLPAGSANSVCQTAQFHGDVIFLPDNSSLGREILQRDPLKWLVSLWMLGYLQFGLWQAKALKLPSSSFN
jgi:FkbM family methyltransferase